QVGFYSDDMAQAGQPGGAGRGQAGGPNMDFGGFDFSDFARQQGGARGSRQTENGGAFRDLFSQFFKGGGSEPELEPEKGSDLEYAVTIDFWQAIRGTQAKIDI